MESKGKDDGDYEWILEKKKSLLRRNIVLEEKLFEERNTRRNSKQKLNRSEDEKVPLPSMFIGLPNRNPPSNTATPTRNAFVKEKIDAYSPDEGFRTKLINDILKKMEYTPKIEDYLSPEKDAPMAESNSYDNASVDYTPKGKGLRNYETGDSIKSFSGSHENLNLPKESSERLNRITSHGMWNLSGISRCGKTSYNDRTNCYADTPVKLNDSLEIGNRSDMSITESASQERTGQRTNQCSMKGERLEQKTFELSSKIERLGQGSGEGSNGGEKSRQRSNQGERSVQRSFEGSRMRERSGIVSEEKSQPEKEGLIGVARMSNQSAMSIHQSLKSGSSTYKDKVAMNSAPSSITPQLEKRTVNLSNLENSGTRLNTLEGNTNARRNASLVERRHPNGIHVDERHEIPDSNISILSPHYKKYASSRRQYSDTTASPVLKTGLPGSVSSLHYRFPRSFRQDVSERHSQPGDNLADDKSLDGSYRQLLMNRLTDEPVNFRVQQRGSSLIADTVTGINKPEIYHSGSFSEDSLAISEDQAKAEVSKLSSLNDINRPIPLPLQRNLSVGLYAIQVADMQRIEEDTKEYTQLIIQARAYRKWCIMFRLRKFIKNEEKRKLERAEKHWRTNQLKKFFNAMKSAYFKKMLMAREWYENRTVEKVFNALFSTLVLRKQRLQEHLEKRRAKVLAIAWVRWTTAVSEVKKDKMRIIFAKWKEKHLKVKREVLLERFAERRATATVYYKWKMTYTIEQQGSISALHFKVVLLSKCWQLWRVYTAERRVKNRMTDVARIHYEQRSLSNAFYQWKKAVGKSCRLSEQLNKRLLAKIFFAWKNWAAYSKVLGQRQMSACKEYHNRNLLRSSMDRWRCELKLKVAIECAKEKQLRKAFQLWSLRLKRKVLHRKLCKAQGRKARQSRCFNGWLEYSRDMKERREQFVKIITKMKLKLLFQRWKVLTSKSQTLGQSISALEEIQSRKLIKTAFDHWKHALEVRYFTKSIKAARMLRIVRNAAKRWRNKVKKKQLNERLISSSPTFDILTLKGAFRKWLHEKRLAEKRRQRALVVASLLKVGCLSRAFAAWRIVTQEDRIIHHMVARMQRRNLARVFDAWRLVLTRKKVSIQYRHVSEIEKLREIFSKWRAKSDKIQNTRSRNQMIAKNILIKCISIWKDHVSELKRRKLALAGRFFSHWRRKVAEVAELRDRERGTEARLHLILKLKFRIWRKETVNLREKRLSIEKAAEKFHLKKLKQKSIKSWRRQFLIHCIVYEYQEEKGLECLENAFQTWKEFVKEQLQDAVERFTDRLERESSPRGILRQHTLSESFGSGGFPPLRSSSGYFGSLPNMAQALSPLPISPLATSNSLDRRRNSPASLSPEHALLSKPRSTSEFSPSSPTEDQKGFYRAKSFDRPKSPMSLRSTGTISSKDRIPITVPPLFTDVSRVQDEEYTEPIQPKSSSLEKNDTSPRRNHSLMKDRSIDDDTPPFPFSNSDEDAMSYYSFQSESVGINREIFMSGTIRHWRQLPLSRTFKAWLKFTQQQRIRRELFQHFVSYKRSFTLRRDFYKWHRKLYCRLVSEKFRRTKLLRKYFKAMSDHLRKQKWKEDRNLIAEIHLKNTRLETKFKMWRKRFLARRRLQSLVGRWQEAIHVSESQRSACERLMKKREYKQVKDAFRIWKEHLQKIRLAKEFQQRMLLKRTVRQWKNTASKQSSLRTKFDTVVLRRSAKVFFEWKRCLENKRAAEVHFQDLLRERQKKVFLVWLSWSKRKKMLSGNAAKFQRKLNFKIVVQAFFIWSEEAARLKMADDHHRESLMIRVLESWHELTEQRGDLRIRLYDFQIYTTKTKLRNVFDWWKKSAICSKVFKERQKIQKQELLRNVFTKWSGDIRQRKWEKHLRNTIQRKGFDFWLKRTVYIKRRRTLAKIAAKKWISRTKACLELRETADGFWQTRDTMLLRRSFLEWREAVNGQKMASFHYNYHLAITTIKSWSNVTKKMKNLRRIQASVEEIIEYNSISTSFCTWSFLFKRCRKNSMVLENYLQLRRQEHLKICFNRIHINALNGRSEKYKVYRLQRMAFQHWMNLTKRCKTLACVKERLMRITLLKMVRHWRKKARDQNAKEKLAVSVARKKEIKQIKKTFLTWLLKTRGRLLARTCFEGHLVKSTFDRWRKSTKAKLNRRNVLQDYQRQRDATKLSERFQYWKRAAAESKKTKKLEEIHVQIAVAHYRDKLIEKCFYNWRNENFVEKLRRKRTTRILQDCFTSWKQVSLCANKVEKIYEQNLLEKAWRQWRVLKIKRQVMKAMEEHESKKMLSEVFSSWYNYTYIRRQALQEFQLRKKQRLFRKWMQEYNKA